MKKGNNFTTTYSNIKYSFVDRKHPGRMHNLWKTLVKNFRNPNLPDNLLEMN